MRSVLTIAAVLAVSACGESKTPEPQPEKVVSAPKVITAEEREVFIKKVAEADTPQAANQLALGAPNEELSQLARERANQLLKDLAKK